jgi:hypothetical protein
VRFALLAALLLLASGCLVRPAATGTGGPPTATATGSATATGIVVVAAPTYAPAPPARDPANFTWSTDAVLNRTAIRITLEPDGPTQCEVALLSAEASDGPGPSSAVLVRAGSSTGLGWGSSGSIARLHAAGLDTQDATSSGHGYGGSLHSLKGTLQEPLEFLVAAQSLAPFPPGVAHFMGIGDHSLELRVHCAKPLAIRAELGSAPALFDPNNLAGGAGAHAYALLAHPFLEVQDKVAAQPVGTHATAFAAVLVDNAARVGLDGPGGHTDWTLTPEAGMKALDGDGGAYAATVDAAGTGLIAGFILGIVATSPVAGLDALAP